MSMRRIQVSSFLDWRNAALWLEDRAKQSSDTESSVREILESVCAEGDDALVRYTQKFDCPDFMPPLRISPQDSARAAAQVPTEQRELIYQAADNIRSFHESQKEKSWFITRKDGTILGQKITPVDAVGLYVPGGQGGNTPLISTLLMTAIPAETAGVKRICVCTPPRHDGSINPFILAAAHILGIDEIYRVGGAWSIGAMAYGTASIDRVDVIAGPGNIYVTTAKRLVQGKVGIDMIAGPSEILIIADSNNNPANLAADMLAQSEHDKLARAMLITDSEEFAQKVSCEIEAQLPKLARYETANASINDNGAIILVDDLTQAIDLANKIAPEHLEICTDNPFEWLTKIRNAGSVFLGRNSPEALGDYYAGPNHTLPTMGTARFSSPLSVDDFVKKSQYIYYTQEALNKDSDDIVKFATSEGLTGHANSVAIRRV